jgi:hypothetical protein
MKVKELITYLQAHCDMELDILMDDNSDSAWNNITVEPITEACNVPNVVGYILVGDNEVVEDKQLKLPFGEPDA